MKSDTRQKDSGEKRQESIRSGWLEVIPQCCHSLQSLCDRGPAEWVKAQIYMDDILQQHLPLSQFALLARMDLSAFQSSLEECLDCLADVNKRPVDTIVLCLDNIYTARLYPSLDCHAGRQYGLPLCREAELLSIFSNHSHRALVSQYFLLRVCLRTRRVMENLSYPYAISIQDGNPDWEILLPAVGTVYYSCSAIKGGQS